MIEFALDGTIIAANENYLKIIEYEANDIIGQHHRIFVEPRYAASDQYLSFWAGLRGGKFQNAEYRRLTGSGRDIWLQASYNPILDAAGRPVRIMKIATDITDMVVAREENRRLAFVDGLTGIGNRRSFDEAIRDEMRRTGRTGAPLSLLMLDVDYFKLFNDHHGHQEGDTCLKAIADTIRRFARRPGDLAARYGGEEFAILLPQTPAAEALELADEVRKAVRKLDVMHCGLTPCGVTTVSIGCATSRVETAASEHASSDLIASADAALYKAKTAGRDCVRTDDISGPDTAVDDILSAYHAAR